MDRPTGTVPIGSELTVTAIGYGAMQLTGPKVWGEYADRDQGIELLRAVVDSGVSYIDTADVYGPHTNEVLIREALHPYPTGLVIATKGGFIRGGPEYADMGASGSRWYLRQAAYLSARRLGVGAIDLYYLHTPTFTDTTFEDAVGTLAELKRQGLIRNIGLSNVSASQLRAAVDIVEIAAVTAHFNVANRDANAARKLASEHGIVFSPWHPGVVPTGPDGDAFRSVLSPIAQAHGASLQQVALAWQLHRGSNVLPVPGTTSHGHLQENIASSTIVLQQPEIDAITALVPEPLDD